MKNLFFAFLITLVSMTMTSCSSVSVNGGEEAVFTEKPVLFGKGGVDMEPLTQGQTWIAATTDVVKVSTTPVTYTESFVDMMTADRTPINFHVYFILKVKSGKSPVLVKGFTLDWYKQSISSEFRTFARNEATPYKMFELTSDRKISDSISMALTSLCKKYIDSIQIPLDIVNVIVGAATPPQEVLEENKRTAAQNQNRLTQNARADAENARKQAEINKATADNAYRTTMGMTMEDYIKIRGLELNKETIEVVRDKQNVTVVLGTGLQPTVPINH